MKNQIFIELFPFALLASSFWYMYKEKDAMAISLLGVIVVFVLIRLVSDLKRRSS